MSNDFYVYQHRRNDTGEVFYVGKGSGDRADHIASRKNRHWHNVVNKHGHTVEIVCDSLDETCAFDLETMLIAYHGRRDIGTGNLVNMTDGGGGVRGRVMPPVSDETRRKQSEAQRGKKKSPEHLAKIVESRRGWRPTDEQRAKQSAALRGRKQSKEHVEKRAAALRGENSPMWGKTLPQETRDKISAAQKGRPLTIEWASNISAGKLGRSRGNGTSAFCGVGAVGNRWRAGIQHEGKRLYLGLHKTQEDAARAYDRAATELYGPSARTNFPAEAAS